MNDAATNRTKWLEKHNFDQNGFTYIIKGETYSIKDELYMNGWKYDSVFKWHKPDPTGYEDRVFQINIDDILEFTSWGSVTYFSEGINKIEKMANATTTDKFSSTPSVWLEEDQFNLLPATLIKKGCYYGKFGLSNIYTFHTEKDNTLVWFTTKIIDFKEGDKVLISGRVKERKFYKNQMQTLVSRCTIKKYEG